jgi:hypothetical protein
MEAQVHPLVVAILRFIQMDMPLAPPFEPPHAVIDPSALRATKAYLFE